MGHRLAVPILTLLLVVAFVAAVPPEPEAPPTVPATPPAQPTETPAPEAAPQRVILRLGRNKEIAGTLQLEDENVVVVRTLDGTVESHPLARVLKIIRLVDPEPDQRGVVILRNGQTTHGVIVRDGFEEVAVDVEGIRVRFKRQDVEEVVLEPTFRQQYERFKASIKPDQVDRRLDLCRWLVRERRWRLARAELDGLLVTAPNDVEARRLSRIVDAQIVLLDRPPAAAPDGDGAGAAPTDDEPDAGPVDVADLVPTRLVSQADVNLVRVYEIDFENPPNVAIPPATIRTLIETYGTDPIIPASSDERTALFRADPMHIVRIMFELRARELYPEIEVLTEPRSLNLFRQRVHDTWLMNGCATSRCHGGPYAGRLFLHHRNYRDDRVRTTNLLILERLELDPEWPLIDYEAPTDSLIVQYGLPRDIARKPHPDVRGWDPVFTRGNRRLLAHTVEWIQSMMQPRPDYPVDYEPPVLGGTRPDDGENR